MIEILIDNLGRPPRSSLPSGQLHTLDITNYARRFKALLAKADVDVAIGAVDFSFNEDADCNWSAFWCPHIYLITSTTNEPALKRALRKMLPATKAVPRPSKVVDFNNVARRRSYALKMNFRRRSSCTVVKSFNGKTRTCRNTSSDKLRAAERLELFIYLDQIGLNNRVIFRGAKPVVSSPKVNIVQC